MTTASSIPQLLPETTLQESVRTYTYLLLRRQDLDSRKRVLEELLIKCDRPLSSPTTPSTISSSDSPLSTASSTRATSYSTYPQRFSSLDTSISSFCSTPWPWKDKISQESLDGAKSNKETVSTAFPRWERSKPSMTQIATSHNPQSIEIAQGNVEVEPLTPKPVKPKSHVSKHHYHQNAMAATLSSYQDAELEIAILDLEIELVIFQSGAVKLWRNTRR